MFFAHAAGGIYQNLWHHYSVQETKNELSEMGAISEQKVHYNRINLENVENNLEN